ncbi:MAG: hypothetical protein AAF517_00405 [Planctomycetota bacterium]
MLPLRGVLAALLISVIPLARTASLSADDSLGSPVRSARSPVEDLVEDLGHEEWSRRHEAESKLRESDALELPRMLRETIESSEDPETTARARYLLDLVDPLIGAFDIIRIDLLPGGLKVTELGHGSGPPMNSWSIRMNDVEDDDTTSPRTSYATSYDVSWTPLSEQSLEVRLESTTSTVRGTPLRFTAKSPSVHLLDVGEETKYLRSGPILDRSPHRFLVLLRQRQGRLSQLGENSLARPPSEVLATSLETLRRTGASTASTERTTALRILGLLADAESRETFESGLQDPQLFGICALGLAAIDRPAALDALRRLVTADTRPEGVSAEAWRRYTLRAAAQLVEAGELQSLQVLVEELQRKSPFALHDVITAVTIGMKKLRESKDDLSKLRSGVLDAILAESFLAEAPWYDPETENLITETLRALDDESAEDRARAERAQRSIERIAAGSSVFARVGFDRLRPMWTIAADKAVAGDKPPSDLSLLTAALSNARSTTAFAEIALVLRTRYSKEPLEPELFDAVIQGYEGLVTGSTLGGLYSTAQGLVGLSSSLVISKGQFVPWVRLLALWRNSPSISSQRRNVDRELERWTGITPKARRAASAGQDPWTQWLNDKKNQAAIAAREEDWLKNQAGPAPDAQLLDFYRFELRKPQSETPGEGDAKLEIVDGVRLRMRVGMPVTFRNRHGILQRVLIDPGPTTSATGRTTTFRLGTRSIYAHVPTLLTGTAATYRHEHFSVSERSPRGRYISRGGPTEYRTLAYIAPVDPANGKTTPDGTPESPTDLWEQFATERLAAIPESVSPSQLSSYLRVLDEVPLSHRRDILRQVLTRVPAGSVRERALGQLLELGDQEAIDLVVEQSKSGTDREKLSSALLLCRLGRDEGPKIIESLRKSPSAKAVLSTSYSRHQAISALELYVSKNPLGSDGKRLLLAILKEGLSETRYQSTSFRAIGRLAGEDFGYRDSLKKKASERSRAIKTAIQLAEAWIAQERDKLRKSSANRPNP